MNRLLALGITLGLGLAPLGLWGQDAPRSVGSPAGSSPLATSQEPGNQPVPPAANEATVEPALPAGPAATSPSESPATLAPPVEAAVLPLEAQGQASAPPAEPQPAPSASTEPPAALPVSPMAPALLGETPKPAPLSTSVESLPQETTPPAAVEPPQSPVALERRAPQIFCPDLVRKQTTAEPQWPVSFILVDEDRITEVTLNGRPVPVTPAKTLVIHRQLVFTPGRNLVEITAKDEAGHLRRRHFLVGYKLDDPSAAEGSLESPWRQTWILGLTQETDSNPTLDLSSPINIANLEVRGVVDDKEQTDSRRTLKLTGILASKQTSFLAGAIDSAYRKSQNQLLNSRVAFLGAGTQWSLGEGSAFKLDYLFTDMNLGGFDYLQSHGLTPAWELTTKNQSGEHRHKWGLELAYRDFADPVLTDGAQEALAWTYLGVDPQGLDRYSSKVSLGTSAEGTLTSQSRYWGADFDWKNRWEAGVLFDLGFGLQYRDYKNELPLSANTPLGATRVDLPLRFSTALGYSNWGFTLKGHYLHQVNLSNKLVYVRILRGLTLEGVF
ncbi:MAG: hypothetical protein A2600_05475 [Candidatus Lambdaproteobacteria bacterium RIFOXYD1_FULL_56_27]|nr:MAG: hypothetical protein A2600_05475 [Candidatus Lambdaproteobacteria bacterium RIFOXYD1_FULL_56_27]